MLDLDFAVSLGPQKLSGARLLFVEDSETLEGVDLDRWARDSGRINRGERIILDLARRRRGHHLLRHFPLRQKVFLTHSDAHRAIQLLRLIAIASHFIKINCLH